MKIYSDGKSRVLNGAFPKHFRLLNGEKEVPFIRTGRESIRISGELPVGDLLVDEIIRQKVAQPAKLDAQSIAIINKQDFDRIDILNKKLVINQEKMGEQMNALAEHEATLANLETKNAGDIELLSGQTASAVQMLKGAIEDTEKKNVTVQKALSQAIKETGEDLSDSLVAHETAKNPHRITKATIGLEKVENIKPEDMPVSKATKKELDKKADKKDIAEVEKKLTEKSDKIVKGIERMNMLGGVGGNELPIGGKKGYVLAKASNKTGDYEWKAGGGGVSIHNDLEGRSAENAHPISSITGLEDALNSKYDASNPSNYQTGTQVANSIATETTNRENADNGLQSQIDAITASSDVKDIVGTYAELEAYDTSTLGNNDIIKVLQDETHSDETTYYRWSTTTETFTLIGEEGPYYTKSEANSTFVPQTRTVNGKALSSDITLTNADIGSQPAGNYVTTDTAQDITATKTFKAPQKFQSGDGGGCMIIGADVSATTVTNGARKTGRMCFYTNEDITLKCCFVSTDCQNVGGGAINSVEFGGRTGDKLNTAPDSMTFTVANSHNSTTSKQVVAEYTSAGSTFNNTNLAPLIVNRTSNNGGSFVKYTRNGTSLGHLGIAGVGLPTFSDDTATNSDVLVRGGTLSSPAVGSATQPVYIDSNGVAQAITDMATTDTAQTISGAKTFTEPVTIQNGQGTGCLIVGANVNSSTLSNNQRKLARINAPSYANKDLGATLIGWDTSGDSDSPVTNKSYDSVCFGGMKKITNCTSPMSITFCVTDTRAATAAANKKYALAMDATEAIFGVQPKYNGYNLATMNDLPTVNNATLTIQKNGTSVATFTANSSTNTTANITVPTTAADVSALPSSTKYGADLSYSSSTLTLLDQDGNALGNSVTISGGGNTNNLLDFKWVDHELNDQSWLKADTFSWQDGTVYSDAYDHLVDDYTNGTSATETIGSYTITYVLADDGHKITTDETTVANIYSESGVAWYYVLDTTNQRFKLPRTKYGFNGLRDEVGKYVQAGLPNITGQVNTVRGSVGTATNGALTKTQTATYAYSGYSSSGGSGVFNISINAQNSNSIYGNSTTVQPPATQMYLYFYVGQFSQSATEQTAGLNASLFNNKVDLDGGWGFPSETYQDLTLLASGSTYTAPANGWFYFSKKATAANQWITLENTTANMSVGGNTIASGQYNRYIIPCKKGDTITVEYSLDGDTMWFRFIYAEDSN